jgi:hypothetical protein
MSDEQIQNEENPIEPVIKGEEFDEAAEAATPIGNPPDANVTTFSIPLALDNDRDGPVINLGDMEPTTTKLPLEKFYERYLRGQINRNPPYQRDSVWSLNQEQVFIGGLLSSGAPQPPPIYVCKIRHDQRTKVSSVTQRWMLIDGKQRCQALTI